MLPPKGQALRFFWEVYDVRSRALRGSRMAWVYLQDLSPETSTWVGLPIERIRDVIEETGIPGHGLNDLDGRYMWRPSVTLPISYEGVRGQHFSIGPEHYFLVREGTKQFPPER